MPPQLDLSATFKYPHADMLSPNISLRKAAAYHKDDRGPLSSTSSRFSFNHLLTSPPPSPGLPALIPRHGKPLPTRKPRTYFRGLLWLTGVVTICWYGSALVHSEKSLNAVGWATGSGEQFEMVGDSELPKYPTPVIVVDKRGRSKWTVSIPPDSVFPLKPRQYADICAHNAEVSKQVADMHRHITTEYAAHFDYYHVDPNFMDVTEAEEHGLLPGPKGRTTMRGGKDGAVIGDDDEQLISLPVCKKTMTFVLETADAGLGNTLMQLWTAYGLAKTEGRDFFIDDSRWAYGEYTDLFQSPPLPDCRPPPRHEMLPCPHHVRHLIVSVGNVPQMFGGAFNDHFENPKKMNVFRQEPIFKLVRAGYEALFKLQDPDAGYVQHRINELSSKTLMAGDMSRGLIVGIHVRHGDRRPYEFQYKDSYVPLTTYLEEAREQLYAAFDKSGPNGTEDMMSEMKSIFVVASDDPDVYSSTEFSHTIRAQEQIRLASKSNTKPAQSSQGTRKFVEESVGWEGGFFAGMFWSLGRPSGLPATAEKGGETALPPSEAAMRLRALVGRAYLMDLAVLGASDRVVCTVSSMGCRLLAVMMGWEKAVVKEGWRNVDGQFPWRGVEW